MQQEGLYLYLMLRHLQHILVENCVRQERIIDDISGSISKQQPSKTFQ